MPIPELTSSGLLPLGIHDCRLDEIGERFGRFQSSDRRPRLFRELRRFCRAAGSTPLISALIINGSFVTAKPDPGDIDLIVVLHPDHDYQAARRPFEYNLISKRRIKRGYGFDVLVARENTQVYEEFVAFFQRVKTQEGDSKGVLRIRP